MHIHILYTAIIIITLVPKYLCNSQCMLPNCLSCPSNPYTCTACPSSALLPSYSQSSSPSTQCCQPQCTTCLQQTQCQSCTTGYILNPDTNICYIEKSCTQPGCLTCNTQKNNTCSLCLDGMVLNQYTKQCLLCPQRCMLCDIQLHCLECQLFYYYNTKTNSCENCQMQGCLTCVAPLACLKCSAGYVLAASFPVCNACLQHCQFCTSQATCQACSPGYYFQATPIQKCKPCSSQCSNCTGNSTNCTACAINYYLNTTTNMCTPCYIVVPMCVSCALNSAKIVQCTACVSQMFADGSNGCKRCPHGCSMCANLSTCTTCMNGYFLQNYFNTTTNTNMTICAACIPNCVQCYNNYTCETCAGYYYQQNASKFECIACPQYCIQYYYINNTCKYCNPGYYISGAQCLPCAKWCGTCTNNPQNCSQCLSSSMYLQTIMHPLTLTKVYRCLPCPLYCNQCKNVDICLQCTGGAVLNEETGQCVKCGVQKCYACELNSVASLCTVCEQGYYLGNNGQVCLGCVVGNCTVCGIGNNTCLQCQQGYWLSTQSQTAYTGCTPCSSNCLQCLNSTICLTCPQQYYLNNAFCLPCITGCQQCLSYTECTQCINGYYIAQYNTDSSTTSNNNNSYYLCKKCNESCLICTSEQVCTLCVVGYAMAEGGQCRACTENCLNCDYQGNCQTCNEGYALMISTQHNKLVIICSQCPNQCQKCITVQLLFQKQPYFHCTQCPFSQILIQPNNTCFICGSTPQTSGCQSCNQYAECISCYTGYNFTWVTSTGGICSNANVKIIDQEDWTVIGACIGLGCLMMALLVGFLWIKLKEKGKVTGMQAEMQGFN